MNVQPLRDALTNYMDTSEMTDGDIVLAAAKLITRSIPKERFNYTNLVEQRGKAILALYQLGHSWQSIADLYGCKPKQLARMMKKHYPHMETRSSTEQSSISRRKQNTPAMERLTLDDVKGLNNPYIGHDK